MVKHAPATLGLLLLALLLSASTLIILQQAVPFMEAAASVSSTSIENTWTSRASMPEVDGRAKAAVVNDKIYVIGGQNQYSSQLNLDITQICDTVNDTWVLGKSAPDVILNAAACATTGVYAPKKIYVMGGSEGLGSPVDRNFVYDPETDVWSIGASLTKPRSMVAIANVDDLLYVIGGTDAWLGVYGQNDQYTPFGYGTVPFVVGVVSPEQNKTYAASNVSLIFTVNKPTLGMVYSLDGQMKIAVTENITLTGLSNGLHNLTIYATDKFGNSAVSETVTFTVAEEQQQHETEPFPTTLVATASAASVAVIGVALLVYLKKRNR